jgi:rubrerythrin
MKNNYNVIEVIQMAINIEREGFAFYSGIAKHASDEKAKAVFIILAEQEKKHIETFTNLLDIISDTFKSDCEYLFDENVSAYFRALTENKVFTPDRMYEASDMTSAKEAIEEGINAEKNSILFYNELLKNTNIPEIRRALELIIQEEKIHIVDLNTLSNTL